MKKILTILLALVAITWSDEGDKHPWYMNFDGNKVFSNYQLEEQMDVPEEFGRLGTTKQDFMMRLSLENVKSLYYSKGYFSLDIQMDIKREYLDPDSKWYNYQSTTYDENKKKILREVFQIIKNMDWNTG